MKISKEVRIGVLVTVAILIFFIGFNFLKNSSLFSKEKEYYCFYGNVDGLQSSSSVLVSGLVVGHVSHMELITGKGVRVTIAVRKEVEIPVGTTASLKSLDLLGTKAIKLEPGAGPGTLKDGAELVAVREGGTVDNIAAEVTPRLKELKSTITNFDAVLTNVNTLINAQNQDQIAQALRSINNSAKNIELLTQALAKESVEITAILHNAKSITGNLESQNDTIKHIMANINKITRQIGDAPIEKTISDLQGTIAQLKEITEKVNKGEGSLGMFINDKDTHRNLNNTMKSLDSLMIDMKAHPSRYINVTIFGSSKKKN